MSNDLTAALTETARSFMSEPQASLLGGILFGGQSHLPKDFVEALRTTGTLHVVAVSGQNMTILAGMVGGISRTLGWKLSLISQGLAIISYVWLVGGGASVIRSGLMALIALFAASTGRQYDSARALLLVGVGMTLLHPDYLSDVGWQLSFTATAGIIWLSPVIEYFLKPLPRLACAFFCVPLAAQLSTWPIIAANFGLFSLVGILANAAIEWTVPWIMALGAVSLLVGQVFYGLGQFVSWLVLVPLTFFIDSVKLFSTMPLAKVSLSDLPAGLIIIYYSILVGVAGKWSVSKA